MRTIETIVYKYDELNSCGKSKAVENLYDLNVDYDWWEFDYDDAKQVGLEITGFDLDSHCKGEFILSANEVCANIFRDHGKECATHKSAEHFMEVWQPVFDEYMINEGYELENKLIEIESDFLEAILQDYLFILREEYKYRTSEAVIIDTIIANEYEFELDGTLA